MAEIVVKGWQCDQCKYIWLRTEVIPTHCPNRKCRSRLWNRGVIIKRLQDRIAGIKSGLDDGPPNSIIQEPVYEKDEYSQ